ncbi:MAG: competence/damage-inducible protein A [Chloroflexi bacterium]|nr:competence/damage-inducible protein A [Chloroflexota bacterium]
MKAEILSIGTELLLGEILDTNAQYLASQLPAAGIDLYFVSQVGDNLKRIADALERGWSRSDLILTTGGLGPTDDDVTRDAIAHFLGQKLVLNPDLEVRLREFFKRRGVEMPSRNLKQAFLIPSAKPILNARGTAPGWWVEKDGKIIVAMPGPPREMTHMWEQEVSPRLRERSKGVVIISRTLKTFGISEAKVDEMVSHLTPSMNPTIGIYARQDGIHLRITAKAENLETAQKLLSPVETEIHSILGESIWGVDGETLERNIGTLLIRKGLSLATMESCTGGLLANAITDNAGSSTYFKGGLVSYTNDMKIGFGVASSLIMQHGAVSPQVSEGMAEAVRLLLDADVGVSITGVAGPSELEGKPAGTIHIGIARSKSKRVISLFFPTQRSEVKRRATLAALFELRKELLLPE